MLFHPVKILLMAYAILFKIRSAHCGIFGSEDFTKMLHYITISKVALPGANYTVFYWCFRTKLCADIMRAQVCDMRNGNGK